MPTPMPSNISVLFWSVKAKASDLHMLPFAVGARRRNVILDVGQEQGQRGEQQRQAPDGKERGTPAVMLRQNPGDRGAESQPHGHGGVIEGRLKGSDDIRTDPHNILELILRYLQLILGILDLQIRLI